MDDLSRKFRSIDWKGLQKSARRVQASTASALKDMVMTDLENKVRAATADTSWGASGSDLMQIAQGTFNREDYALIMSIVWQRLGSSRWRCVFKSLEVLRYLIMHGAARCADEARSAAHHIQTLQHFRYVDPKTRRDHGEGVRTRAKLVCDMLADEAVLDEEREKSKELRSKLQGGISVGPGGRLGGLSSDDFRFGTGGSGGSTTAHVTTTSTGGVGSFKGYGDDDVGTGGYDDAPTGSFARRAAAEANAGYAPPSNVPDLMGDAQADGPQKGGGNVFADGDDDDFDPRAGSLGGAERVVPPLPGTGGDDDLFGSLGLSDTPAETPPPSHLADAAVAKPSGPMATSLLIQSLAQKQYQQQNQSLQLYQPQVQENDGQVPLDSPNLNPSTHLASSNHSGFEYGMDGNISDPQSKSQAGSGIPVQHFKSKVTSKPDTDPFSDLVDSAKKSGVL